MNSLNFKFNSQSKTKKQYIFNCSAIISSFFVFKKIKFEIEKYNLKKLPKYAEFLEYAKAVLVSEKEKPQCNENFIINRLKNIKNIFINKRGKFIEIKFKESKEKSADECLCLEKIKNNIKKCKYFLILKEIEFNNIYITIYPKINNLKNESGLNYDFIYTITNSSGEKVNSNEKIKNFFLNLSKYFKIKTEKVDVIVFP